MSYANQAECASSLRELRKEVGRQDIDMGNYRRRMAGPERFFMTRVLT